MYYSNGEYCDSKTDFLNHELNSMQWTETTLFETLLECCKFKFWWKMDECMDKSPKEITFNLSIDMVNLVVSNVCQDVDRYGLFRV